MKRLMQSGRSVLGTMTVALVLAAAGCGSSGNVTGKVTYKDKALGGGTVQFIAKDGTTRTSRIGPDGNYSIEKMPVGLAKIIVETESARRAGPNNVPKPPANVEMPPEATASAVYGGAQGTTYTQIPDKYADPEKSGLEFDVKKGPQDFNIPLN